MLAPCWAYVGLFGGLYGAPWRSLGGEKNLQRKVFVLRVFFSAMLRAMWGQFGSCWACWAYVGPKVTHQTSEIVQKRVKPQVGDTSLFGAYVGPYGVHVGPMLCYLEPCWGHVGPMYGKINSQPKTFRLGINFWPF